MNFQGAWHFMLPPDAQVVSLPKLPAQFAEVAPSLELGMFVNRLTTIDVPTITSYDAIRAMGTGVTFCPECAVRVGEIQRVIISGF
jgi:hypothetical protein